MNNARSKPGSIASTASDPASWSRRARRCAPLGGPRHRRRSGSTSSSSAAVRRASRRATTSPSRTAPLRHPRRPERVGDAGAGAGTRCGCSRPPASTGSGHVFSGAADSFPTKDEMADYLEAYAARFELPVRNGVQVSRVARQGDATSSRAGTTRSRRSTSWSRWRASSAHACPRSREIWSDIVQLHSSEYRNPSQLRDGGVLLVGAGNSGAEIALEVAVPVTGRGCSGRDTGHVPFRSGAPAGSSSPASCSDSSFTGC